MCVCSSAFVQCPTFTHNSFTICTRHDYKKQHYCKEKNTHRHPLLQMWQSRGKKKWWQLRLKGGVDSVFPLTRSSVPSVPLALDVPWNGLGNLPLCAGETDKHWTITNKWQKKCTYCRYMILVQKKSHAEVKNIDVICSPALQRVESPLADSLTGPP